METVQSADGTTIAFDTVGRGPALILANGALADLLTGSSLADVLASDFTVYRYDRRGRGSSGDTEPYSPQREIEDLDALLVAAGGSARVFGHSSGAVLGLEAAAAGLPITRLAAYEPPFIVGNTRARPPDDLADQVRALLDAGRRADAVRLFWTDGVGMPPEVITMLEASPTWSAAQLLAHTLPYDLELCGPGNRLPTDRMATIRVPTLVLDGGASPAWACDGVQALVDVVPDAGRVTLEGQTHGADDKVLAPVLVEFLA